MTKNSRPGTPAGMPGQQPIYTTFEEATMNQRSHKEAAMEFLRLAASGSVRCKREIGLPFMLA
jgi:hypothetical protein